MKACVTCLERRVTEQPSAKVNDLEERVKALESSEKDPTGDAQSITALQQKIVTQNEEFRVSMH